MKLRHLLFYSIVLMLVLGSISASLSAVNLPQLVAARITSAPVMDGTLNDSAWADAQETNSFAVLDKNHSKPDCPTYVKALADDKAIYLGFRCIEPFVAKIPTKEEPRDGSAWLQESIDIVISSTLDSKECYHLITNISGGQYDAKVTTFVTGSPVEDSAWNGDWQVKTSRGDKEWYAVVRIPFDAIGADLGKNSVLRVNFSRTRHIDKEQDSTWAPNIQRFLEPANLGELIIPKADGSYVQIKFPRLASAIVGVQHIPFSILNHSNVDLQPKLIIKLTYYCSGVNSLRGIIPCPAIPAGKEVSSMFPLSIQQTGVNSLDLEVVDSISGKTLISSSREINATQSIVFDEALYALYQKKAVADLEVRVPSDRTKLVVSLLKDDSKSPLATKTFNSPLNGSIKVSFDLNGMNKGAYKMRAVLVRDGVAFGESFSRKFPYTPNPKKSLDKNGLLLVDGKPFFPVGIYSLVCKDRRGTTDEIVKEAKQAGFNTTVLYEMDSNILIQELDVLERNGIKALVYPTVPISLRKGNETTETLHRDLDIRKDHPAVLGWYVVDEPEGIGLSPAPLVRDLFQAIKEYDQEHPCAMVVMGAQAAGNYRSCTDIMWADPYPVPRLPVTNVSDVIADSVKNIEKDKPLWCVPQAFDWSVWETGKVDGVHRPTPDEERCMTYLALVSGAKGIIYWAHTGSKYYIQDYPEHWTSVKKIAGELRDLSPVLLTKTINNKLSVLPKSDAIQTMLKKIDGKWYIIAVNSGNTAIDVDFSLRDKFMGSRLEVVFENRFLAIKSGKWKDNFKPLEVHVYKVNAQ